jgi:hypothetical protein
MQHCSGRDSGSWAVATWPFGAARADIVIREFAFSAGTAPQLITEVTRGADVRDIDAWSARVKQGGEPPRPTRVGVVVVYAVAKDS